MSEQPPLSCRLSPALQTLLAARGRQGRHVPDVIHAACEVSLGVRPTARPGGPGPHESPPGVPSGARRGWPQRERVANDKDSRARRRIL